MADLKSDHARARAMDLLTIADPVADDEQSRQLRELAVKYLEVAERFEAQEQAQEKGRAQGNASESSGNISAENISAALDAVAQDFFSHPVLRHARSRKRPRRKPKQDGE